ncbi:MAG: protein kinase [Pirellulales bacterium]|nr:protein kinase [Pirellulales bacterium]
MSIDIDLRAADDPSIDSLLDRLESLREQYAEETFAELVALDPLLTNACRASGELAQELQRRLDALDAVNRVVSKRAERYPAIPGYEIHEVLGRGGTSIVYRGTQLSLGREVAIKVIVAGQFASARSRARLHIEAASIARLHHPCIVQVHEAAEFDNLPFMVEELIEGGNLARWANGKSISPDEAARWVKQIAEGVEHAHSRGVLHRDLKPSNILLTTEETPKISDFGLAKLLNEERDLTFTGEPLGTACYMAPEQAIGVDAGPATDIYGLGAILYELLTGEPPHGGANRAETMLLVRGASPTPPRALAGRIPRDLEAVCLKCLEKEPARRYASAQRLAEDLDRFLTGRPTVARPAGPLRRAVKTLRRRPELVWMAALAIMTALATVNSAWGLRREMTAREGEGVIPAMSLVDTSDSAARQHSELEYAVDLREAFDAYQLGDGPRLRGLLDRYRDSTAGVDLRDFAWRYLDRQFSARPSIVDSRHQEGYAIAWSPTEALLATGGKDGHIRLWRGNPLECVGDLAPAIPPGADVCVNDLAFSADGRLLASVSCDKTARIWDVGARREAAPPIRHEKSVTSVALHPSGEWLATGCNDDQVRVWSLADHALVKSLPTTRMTTNRLDFCEHGLLLAATCSSPEKGHTWIWKTSDWQLLNDLPIGAHDLRFMRHSPTLIVGSQDFQISLLYAHTGRAFTTLGVPSDAQSLAVSDDNRWLAAACNDGAVRVWNELSGEARQLIHRHAARMQDLDFSQLHSSLAAISYDGKILLWSEVDPAGGEAMSGKALGPPPGARELDEIDISPTLHWMAQRRPGQQVELWDVRQRHARLRPAPERGVIVFDPNDAAPGVLVAKDSNTARFELWNETATLPAVDASAGQIAVDHLAGTHALLSPDGMLATDSGRWGAQLTSLAPVGDVGDCRLAYCDEHGLVALCAAPAEPLLVDLTTGQRLPLPLNAGDVKSLQFSPDGNWLAVTMSTHEIQLVDTASGQTAHVLPVGFAPISTDFSADSRTLAAAGGSLVVPLWNVATGQRLGDLKGIIGQVRRVRFSGDGLRLGAAVWDSNRALAELYVWGDWDESRAPAAR